MSFEIDSLEDDQYFEFAHWMQRAGLWDGRQVTIEEAPAFQKEMEARLYDMLFSLNPNGVNFDRLGVMLACLGVAPENKSLLARDIQALKISSEGVVVLTGFKRTVSNFWKEHKTAIIIGVGVLAVVGVGVLVYVCASGAAAGVATLAGGAAECAYSSLNEDSSPKTTCSTQVTSQGVHNVDSREVEQNIEPYQPQKSFSSNQVQSVELPKNYSQDESSAISSLSNFQTSQNTNDQWLIFSPKNQSPTSFGGLTSAQGTSQSLDLSTSSTLAPLLTNTPQDGFTALQNYPTNLNSVTDYSSFLKNTSVPFDLTPLSNPWIQDTALSNGQLNQSVAVLTNSIKQDPTRSMAYLDRGIANLKLGNYDSSAQDYKNFKTLMEQKQPLSVTEFSLGFAKGLPKGIYDSSEGLFLFLTDAITSPIQTSKQMYMSLSELSKLTYNGDWERLKEVLLPEIHELVKNWDHLSSEEKGRLAGYAFGKNGADILIPGSVAKLASKSAKTARTLTKIQKGLKATEKTLVLESVVGAEGGAKVAEALQSTQKTLALGTELGFSPQDLSKLKQAGALEVTVGKTIKHVFDDPYLQQSYIKIKQAEIFLDPYVKIFMPEAKARQLIAETGIQTFPRPKGIPENYLARITDKGAGIEYVHPENKQISVRVMPGKPHSPFPYQQNPYVVQRLNEKGFDKHGRLISLRDPEVHVPFSEFIYISEK